MTTIQDVVRTPKPKPKPKATEPIAVPPPTDRTLQHITEIFHGIAVSIAGILALDVIENRANPKDYLNKLSFRDNLGRHVTLWSRNDIDQASIDVHLTDDAELQIRCQRYPFRVVSEVRGTWPRSLQHELVLIGMAIGRHGWMLFPTDWGPRR